LDGTLALLDLKPAALRVDAPNFDTKVAEAGAVSINLLIAKRLRRISDQSGGKPLKAERSI
jgi:hypothetical protein